MENILNAINAKVVCWTAFKIWLFISAAVWACGIMAIAIEILKRVNYERMRENIR